jgi:hypothetical protein
MMKVSVCVRSHDENSLRLIEFRFADITELQMESEDIRMMLERSISEASKESGSRSSFKRLDRKQSNAHKDAEESKEKANEKEGEEDVDKLIEAEEAAVGNVAFGVYLRYFKSVGTKLIVAILLFVFCSEASAVLSNCE